MAGSFPTGDFPDIEIFMLGLTGKLAEGEKAEVDEGYSGDLPIRPKRDYRGKDECEYKNGTTQACNECINHIFKQLGILGQKFRHSRHRHGDMLLVVTTILQNKITDGRRTFQVEYKIKKIQ